MKIDAEFRGLIPPLAAEERQQLEENIRRDGCRDPLVIWHGEDVLLDGHNRLEICEKHGIPYAVQHVKLAGRDDALLWIIDNQRGRRNLAGIDRVALGRKHLEIQAKKAAERQRAAGVARAENAERDEHGKLGNQLGAPVRQAGESPLGEAVKRAPRASEIAAKAVGLGARTLEMGLEVLDKAPPETIEAIRRGETSIKAEYRRLKTEENREERTQAILAESKAGDGPTTSTRYPVLLADPPWRYEHSESATREIENHYPTMNLREICDMKVSDLVTDSAVLYLWTTSPKLEEGLEVMRSWGFRYRSCFVWVKDKIGMGYWARQRHELLLVGTRGTMPAPAPELRPDSVIEAPRGEHSAKPAEVYDLIEKQWPTLPKLELFARVARTGWDRWGHEA